jgi:hypothetical protein
VSRRVRLALLAAVLGVACEPITVRVLPGGGIVVEEPESPEQPQEPGPEDAGTDAGVEDAGIDAGPGDAGTDAGTDGGVSPWSQCVAGWQHRVALPLGGKGNPRFGLDGAGEAYFLEYTDGRFKVVSTAPGFAPSDTGWEGAQWVGGVRVDGRGVVHLGISPADAGTEPMHALHLSNAGGSWARTKTGPGLVLDFDLDAEGHAHVLTVREDQGYRLLYMHDRSGSWTVEDTGVDMRPIVYRAVSLRADARGHAHLVYQGVQTGNPGTFYATNASGTWVRERVSEQGRYPVVAPDSTGTPHVFFPVDGWLYTAVPRAGGGWDVTPVMEGVGTVASASVDARGVVHALTKDLDDRQVHHVSNASGSWKPTRLVNLQDPGILHPVSEVYLTLDGQGRAHAMMSLMVRTSELSPFMKFIQYVRQCP